MQTNSFAPKTIPQASKDSRYKSLLSQSPIIAHGAEYTYNADRDILERKDLLAHPVVYAGKTKQRGLF